jgi:hypothetical protein
MTRKTWEMHKCTGKEGHAAISVMQHGDGKKRVKINLGRKFHEQESVFPQKYVLPLFINTRCFKFRFM